MENKKFDVVIAGSGISGSLIAHQLSKHGLNVAIIDAGNKMFFDLETGMDQRQSLVKNFFVNPVKMPNAGYPNLDYAPSPTQTTLNKYYVQKGPTAFQSVYNRIVGGTTYHWLGTALRYVPNTFRENSMYNRAVDWPISYNDLQEWYWKAEVAIGVSGDSNIDLGCPRRPGDEYPMPPIMPSYNDQVVKKATQGMTFEQLPIEFETTPQARNSIPYQDRPPCAGSANCIPICPIQAKYDATVHLKMALNPQLDPQPSEAARAATPIFGAVVTKVLASKNGLISSLQIKRPDGMQENICGKIFVLAMNAIETPKVLLMSNSEQFPNGVANSSGVIGRYLMDHNVKISYATLPQPMYLFRGPLSTSGCESLRDGVFRKHRAAFRLELQNTGTSWATGSPFSNVIDLVGQGLAGRKLREKLAWEVNCQIEINGLLEPEPSYENCIIPSKTLMDPLGIPRPQIHYQIDNYTKEGTKAFIAVTTKIYEKMGASNISYAPGWFGAGHVMGTTRMGNDAATSCCDSYGRTHDHNNLFLMGSGTFPTVGSANPTLTIAALSLRTAKEICDSFSKG